MPTSRLLTTAFFCLAGLSSSPSLRAQDVPSEMLTKELPEWIRFSFDYRFPTPQARDGVYNAGGALMFRDNIGRSGRHVGEEVNAVAQYAISLQRHAGAGVGHLFPGQFLQAQSPGAGLNYPYLAGGYSF